MKKSGESIVFFDGYCDLCHGRVRFLLWADRKGRLKFSSIQSPVASELLGAELAQIDPEKTIIFFSRSQILTKSDAVLNMMAIIGLPWSFVAILSIVPRSLRDFVYDTVARHRYFFFKRYEACPLPPSEHRHRFLDLESR